MKQKKGSEWYMYSFRKKKKKNVILKIKNSSQRKQGDWLVSNVRQFNILHLSLYTRSDSNLA